MTKSYGDILMIALIIAGIVAICIMNIYVKYQSGTGLLYYIKQSGLTMPGVVLLSTISCYLLYAIFSKNNDDQ